MTKQTLKRAKRVVKRRVKREAKRERASLSIRYGVYAVLRYLLLGFILVSIVNLIFTYGFNTPKMNNIWRGNAELVAKYEILNEKIRSTNLALDEIKHRDNAVYRQLFGVDTLTVEGVYTDYPEAKYADLEGERYAPLMVSTSKNLDRVSRRVYLQSLSLDELQALANDKEHMATAMPALIPVNPQDITHVGPFRMNRLNPVLGIIMPHRGIDLTARTGNPVYATGDGFVSDMGYNAGGYGNEIIVNHGFGYQTRYAHLSRILVARGQFVKRGEQIGEVGSTGRSTGPHLHYEVIYRGTKVDPMNYIQVNMDPVEFEKIVEKVNENAIQN